MHIHVPAGAVPKDGPSAGVTMATAIASLVRDEPVADDVGMTGEITLTGQVLPIGGIREKSLAAQRAGLKRVIFPRENETDLADLPPETREALTFIPADTIEDVFAAAFDGTRPGAPQRGPARGRAAGPRELASASRSSAQRARAARQARRPRSRAGGRAAGAPCRPLSTNVISCRLAVVGDHVRPRAGGRPPAPSRPARDLCP